MGRKLWQIVALSAACLFSPGCVSTPDARYVYQDGEFGVIGIPRNSSLGKKDYRKQADELMTKHFPGGYEIVRSEEVVEGERILDTARKLELDSEPSVAALNQILKVGKFARVTSLDQKDSLKITESRIIYRRKPDGPSNGRDGFTHLANLSPEFYLDPNQEIRREIKEGTYLAKKTATTKPDDKKLAELKIKDVKDLKETKDVKVDPDVQKAGHAEAK